METTSIVARWRWREDRSLAALADEAGVPVAVVARLEEPDGPFRVDRESLVSVGAAMGLPEGPELVRGAGFEADARILEARLRSDNADHPIAGGSGSSRSMGYGTSASPSDDEDAPTGE